MREINRRTMIGLLGTTAVAGVAGRTAAKGRIERLLSTGSPPPENLAFDADGNLYVGITGGEVRRIPAEKTDETGLDLEATDEVATYEGGVNGVEVADGTVYTAVNGDEGSVFQVGTDGDDGPSELATISPSGDGFVNDIFADGDRLLVTESFGGAVYEVDRDGGDSDEPEEWVQDDLLDTASFGANGLTRIDDDVYVAVSFASDDEGTQIGRIVRVPVESDGSAGRPETHLEGPEITGVDGLTARGPILYAALNVQNRIARVTPSKKIKTVDEGDPLRFPSDVVFDPTTPGKVFVCNFPQTEKGANDDGGVLRTRPG